MEKLKRIWKQQDTVNKIILLSGIVLAIVCLVMGKGLYGLVFLILMGVFSANHGSQRAKRLGRLYGTLAFRMPDGEMVPITFEQVKSEYVHGQGGKYVGRRLTVQCPFWRLDEEGNIETGFGLSIHVDGNEAAVELAKSLRRDEFISATGSIVAAGRQYFYLGEVEDLHRIDPKTVYDFDFDTKEN